MDSPIACGVRILAVDCRRAHDSQLIVQTCAGCGVTRHERGATDAAPRSVTQAEVVVDIGLLAWCWRQRIAELGGEFGIDGVHVLVELEEMVMMELGGGEETKGIRQE
ncbi:hypothetical protein C8J57DRAFT_1226362 [Mycena rebaudengoi]|nr:hypothetical protein C8J57DRAFT_1226362 [Mycena rebaudengoi]